MVSLSLTLKLQASTLNTISPKPEWGFLHSLGTIAPISRRLFAGQVGCWKAVWGAEPCLFPMRPLLQFLCVVVSQNFGYTGYTVRGLHDKGHGIGGLCWDPLFWEATTRSR